MPAMRRLLVSAACFGLAQAARLFRKPNSELELDTRIHARELTPRVVVRKSLTDKREYLHTSFDSGLRVVAIRDAEAVKTGFAVAVEAGMLEDPPEFQGLAHFCEHMLFLGSKKYPDTEAFSNQLANFGGNHNAYTSAEETVYYNEIGNAGLEKGLDIFAQFFIAPTFASEMVDKEIHAVDSEHKKNQPNTQRRLWHLLRSRANPENPMHQFSTGDLETLKTVPEKAGLSLVKALREFHNKNYCANRMHLVLVGNHTTDELLTLAHKSFDAVPKATAETCPPRPEYYNKPAYTHELGNLGRMYTVRTEGAPQMWVQFVMPPLKKEYKASAQSYVWNALGNYGPGSLKAILMEEELSNSYSYSADNSVSGSTAFVTFQLTEKGAKNTDKVLEHFFAYMQTIRKDGVNMKIIDGMKQMNQVSFDYAEKTSAEFDFVSAVAGSTTHYEPEDLMVGGSLIEKPNEELVKQVLAAYSPDNMNIALVTPSFNESTAKLHEKYYDFGYADEAIDAALIAQLKTAHDDRLVAAPELKYVPHKVDLITEGAGPEGPARLGDGRTAVWWLGMGEAKLPKAIIQIKVGFPSKVVERVEDNVLAGMHSRLVQTVLEEPSDALQMCGLSYSVSAHNDGLGISFSGFDEHILELAKLVLPAIRKPVYTDQQFESERRQMLLDISDVTRSEPYNHAMEAFEVVTVKGHYARAELLKAAKSTELVNRAAHQRFLQDVFADAELTVLFTGNVDKERAQALTKEVENLLEIPSAGKSKDLTVEKLTVINPKEEVEIRMQNPIPGDPNSATLVAYQFGVPDVKDRIHLAMLGSIIDRPVFEVLRTEHQLGYVVFGYVAPHVSIVEVRVLVQGFREGPDAVGALIESTVQNLTSKIASIDQAEFDQRKQTLRTSLAKKDMTMGAFAGRYWGQIWDDSHCFNKQQLQLNYIDSGKFNSPAPLLEAWKKAVAPSAARKKISVKLFGAQQPGAPATVLAKELPGAKVITLIDSTNINTQFSGESRWPHEMICKDPLAQ